MFGFVFGFVVLVGGLLSLFCFGLGLVVVVGLLRFLGVVRTLLLLLVLGLLVGGWVGGVCCVVVGWVGFVGWGGFGFGWFTCLCVWVLV